MSDRQLKVWPSLTPAALLARVDGPLPYPLQDPNCRMFVLPRHALHAGVGALALRPGDQVLVPAYHDPAAVEALIRAGIDCVFYGATPSLEPDLQELSDLIGPRCRALYLTHMLGFARDAERWRRWCDERGLLLIEDATQAWLATIKGQPVGSHGDLSVYGFHNTLPLADLNAAVWSPPMTPTGGKRAESLVPGSVEEDLEQQESTLRPGRWAEFLLTRLARHDPARARRENYRLLLEQLADLVPEPFHELPDEAAPFAFPVAVPDKAALIARLADRGVRAVDMWPTPHPSAPPDQAATAAHRRRSTLALPVHQQLSSSDLERVAEAVRPPTRRRDCLYVERTDDMDELRVEWTALAARTRNIFATWEWHRTWWDHFGGGRPLVVTALRDGSGALRAVLPLYEWAKRPLRVARFVGNNAGDELGPICAPGDEQIVSRAIRGLLRNAEWDAILGEQLPADSSWGKRLSGRTVRREGSPVMRFRGSWEETTEAWSRGLRKDLRRYARRLRDHHEVQVKTIACRSDLEGALDTFFRLHRSRWTEGTRFERRESFHRDFARRALDNGWLRLRITEANGDPAAGLLGFRFGGAESGYQTGWEAAYADYSVGILLWADTIREAHEDGMQEYRFLRGGEAYKYRFANADPGLETVLLSRSSVSGLAAAGVTLMDTPVPRYLRSFMASNG